MSRWMQYRERYQRKRNAFRLLTMSGAIRSADVEVPYLRETRFKGRRSGGSSTVNPVPQVAQSIWTMDLKQRFFNKLLDQCR